MELRKKIPCRRQNVKIKTNYEDYKQDLREDFEEKCAYCGDSDAFCGGVRNYHIDHFAPKAKFPFLVNTYSNLLYACPYCNNGKSDKWEGSNASSPLNSKGEGFCDPCSSDYDKHLKRNRNGFIEYVDNTGKYMYRNLKLYLVRHALIYTADSLKNKIHEIDAYINNNINTLPGSTINQLNEIKKQLAVEFVYYFDDISNIQ